MKTDEAKRFAERALDQLAAALDAGHSEALQAYLRTAARFWRYSWGNVLLIASQRPSATKVAGYQTWRKCGRYVKKGERGVVILAPMMRRLVKAPEEADDTLGDGAENTEERPPERLVGFRAAHVFDISQTDGQPLPEFAKVTGDPAGYVERLKKLVADRGIALRYSDRIGAAEGMSSGGCITIRPGLTPAAEFAVIVHECAHELMHQKDATHPSTRKVRETEAEAVAFVVCEAIGLGTGSCVDYIHLYDGDKDTLAASLERIRKTAAGISEGIQGPEEAELRAAA
jgi:hypothetical protein